MKAQPSALCSVVETIAAHAAQQSKHPAVSAASGTISYAALWEYSTRVAARLCAQQAARGNGSTPIAILMGHDAPLACAILGVLQSKRPYAALDPRFPPARLQSILQDLSADVLLADNAHQSLARQSCEGGNTPVVINVEEIASEASLAAPLLDEVPLREGNHLRDAAAIFYTSGSTGAPKGVLQNHLCLAHTARNYAHVLQLSKDDQVLFATSAAVGASSSLLWGTLCSGATLHIFDLPAHNLAALARQMREERITVLHCVPPLFRALFENTDEIEMPFLRAIKLGGEAVTGRDLRLFQQARKQQKLHPDCRFINGLGITEAGGNVCFYDATNLDAETVHNIPVGFAAHGYELELQPNETSGELIVVSDVLADGYWNKPQETAAVFGTRPDGKRFYRSGDAARINEDGALEYSGRLDHRVQVRGRQVNLLEVEAALQSLLNVERAVVVFCEKNEPSAPFDHAPFLTACYQSRDKREIQSEDLRLALSQTLPDFMLPAQYLHVEKWPLLPNGKTDRRVLQANAISIFEKNRAAAESDFQSSNAYDPLEAQLQRIWQKALRIKSVQTSDDFFAIGGHSLAAAQIIAELHRRFHLEIPLSALASHPTIRQLALALRRQKIDNRSRYLSFNSQGARAPLFFAPGAGSDAFSLVELARHMDAEQPFIALYPPGFDGVAPLPHSVEGFAEYYLQAIREVAPRGPYFLGGSSFGGVVMFEIARRLQAQNEDVALLALVDAKAVGYPSPRRVLFGSTPTPLYAAWKMLPLADKFSFAPRNIARGLREKPALWQARREIGSDRPRPFARRFMHLRLASFAAKKKYRPAPYRGDVHLFPSSVQPLASVFETDENLGWTSFVSGQLIRRVLPGQHNDYMREPTVRILAEFLSEALQKSQYPTRSASDGLY